MDLQPQGGLAVRSATAEEFAVAIGWACDEGWNPGLADLEAFFAADSAGFLMGFAEGKPVSSISVVRYGEDHGFLGFYIVDPEARGRGFGMATWSAGMACLDNRTVGLDGVVAQQNNYKRSGFRLVGRNIRFTGVPKPPEARESAVMIGRARVKDSGLIETFDREAFGAPRPDFLRSWVFAAPEAARTTLAAFDSGDLAGFATIRRCVTGCKIGPLFANNRHAAEALFSACCAEAGPGEEITLDVPETNRQAMMMAQSAGLEPVFETARMYRGPAPDLPWPKIFGVTSFELG